MSLIEFIATYGYWAVLAGTLLEGESILLLAGFAAHRGHLSLPLVLAIGFIGGTLGDQVFFWIGRRWGAQLLLRLPSLRARTLRVSLLLRSYDAALVFGVRFLYGLRIAGPIAMGALGVASRRFAIFNALGAAVWSVLVGGLGYVLGHTVETLLGDIDRYEGAVLAAAAAGILVALLARRAWRALRTAALARAPEPTREGFPPR